MGGKTTPDAVKQIHYLAAALKAPRRPVTRVEPTRTTSRRSLNARSPPGTRPTPNSPSERHGGKRRQLMERLTPTRIRA
jgi:hypothetical protein